MNKILIVEDNADVASLLHDLLVRQGYDVSVCYDGIQGFEFAQRQKPNLILLDLMLPGGGGFYVLERLKLSTMTKFIPVVVLTASKDPEHRKKAEDMDVAAFVEKPYDNKQLLTIIQGVIASD